MAISEEIQFILDAADNLPPLPETLTRVLQRSADKDVSLREIASLVFLDAGLTTRILKTANSAYYNPVDEITSIEAAVSRLGLNTIRNILLTLSLLDAFPRIYEEYYAYIFHSSINTALAAESLAGLTKPVLKSDAFFSGLLLNVGKLLFLRYLEEKYIRIMRDAQKAGVEIQVVEKQVLGIDHLQAGSVIARRWKLPAVIVTTLENYNQPPGQEKDQLGTQQRQLIDISHAARHASAFYLSWDKLTHYGLYLLQASHTLGLDSKQSRQLLQDLPEQFYNISSSLGIKLKKAGDFNATFDAALKELPALQQKQHHLYMDAHPRSS